MQLNIEGNDFKSYPIFCQVDVRLFKYCYIRFTTSSIRKDGFKIIMNSIQKGYNYEQN